MASNWYIQHAAQRVEASPPAPNGFPRLRSICVSCPRLGTSTLVAVILLGLTVLYTGIIWWIPSANLYNSKSAGSSPLCSSWASVVCFVFVGIVVCVPVCGLGWQSYQERRRRRHVQHPLASATAPAINADMSFKQWSRIWLAFVVLNLAWFLTALHAGIAGKIHVEPSAEGWLEFAGAKAAWPAMWCLALTVFPVNRNLPALAMIGVSHYDVVRLHIWSAHAAGWWMLLHTAFISIAYALRYRNIQAWLATMILTENRFTEAPVNFCGWISMTFFSILWLSSLSYFRNRYFSTFSKLHFLALPFLLFAALHDYNTLYFVFAGGIAWSADVCLRHSTKRVCLGSDFSEPSRCCCSTGELTISTCGTCARITFPKPAAWPQKITPGQFVYLKFPEVAKHQWHPYSLSFVQEQAAGKQRCAVYVRHLGDWSEQVLNQITLLVKQHEQFTELESGTREIDSNAVAINTIATEHMVDIIPKTSFAMEVEGPYGHSLSAGLRKYRYCVFVAGGVGITSLSMALAERVSAMGTTSARLVWAVRETALLDLFSEFITLLVMSEVNHVCHLTQEPEELVGVESTVIRNGSSQTTRKEHRPVLSPARHSLAIDQKDRLDHLTKLPRRAVLKMGVGPLKPMEASKTWLKQWNFLTILGALLGAVGGHFLARQICCFDYNSDGDGHICRLLGSNPTPCVGCDPSFFLNLISEKSNHTEPFTSLPCCTLPVCYFCFRGLPFILAGILSIFMALLFPEGCYQISLAWRWLSACSEPVLNFAHSQLYAVVKGVKWLHTVDDLDADEKTRLCWDEELSQEQLNDACTDHWTVHDHGSRTAEDDRRQEVVAHLCHCIDAPVTHPDDVIADAFSHNDEGNFSPLASSLPGLSATAVANADRDLRDTSLACTTHTAIARPQQCHTKSCPASSSNFSHELEQDIAFNLNCNNANTTLRAYAAERRHASFAKLCLQYGRPNIPLVMASAENISKEHGHPVCVVVCGPQPLCQAVRKAYTPHRSDTFDLIQISQ